jgi:hypothetical protein
MWLREPYVSLKMELPSKAFRGSVSGLGVHWYGGLDQRCSLHLRRWTWILTKIRNGVVMPNSECFHYSRGPPATYMCPVDTTLRCSHPSRRSI